MTFAGEFLGLPGLRGYWPMSAFFDTGNAVDMSSNDRTLAYNGNPTYNYHASGGPYCDLDGTGDYFSRADEAGLDIIGTESYVATAQRGLTLGGWFWFDSLAAAHTPIAKWDATGNNRSYLIQAASSGTPTFYVSSNGTATTSVNGGTLSISTWYFIVGRFIPSTEISIFINGTETPNTTSIPAAIFNGTAIFNIGAINNTAASFVDGRVGLCFLCAMALSDTAIDNIYENTKASYGL